MKTISPRGSQNSRLSSSTVMGVGYEKFYSLVNEIFNPTK